MLQLTLLLITVCACNAQLSSEHASWKQRIPSSAFEQSGKETNGILQPAVNTDESKETDYAFGELNVMDERINNDRKIRFEGTSAYDAPEWICRKECNDIVAPISFAYNGTLVPVGSVFVSDLFYYQCSKDEFGQSRLDIIGCTNSEDLMIEFGEMFVRGNFLYSCTRFNDTVAVIGLMCFNKDGRRYKIGESWAEGTQYYQCIRNGTGTLRIDTIGCADGEERKMEVGERFVKDSVVYECQYINGTYSVKAKGCFAYDSRLHQPKIYALGEKWYEADKDNYGFVRECVATELGINGRITECVYFYGGGFYHIDLDYRGMVPRSNLTFYCVSLGSDNSRAFARLFNATVGYVLFSGFPSPGAALLLHLNIKLGTVRREADASVKQFKPESKVNATADLDLVSETAPQITKRPEDVTVASALDMEKIPTSLIQQKEDNFHSKPAHRTPITKA